MASSIDRIVAEPLTDPGFAPFGSLVAAPAAPGRRRTDGVELAAGRTLVLSTTHAPAQDPPIRVSELERHPHSSQTFLPLDVSRWLVVVSTSLDVADVRAFVAGPAVGVTIARNVWHHGLTVLDTAGRFAVLMGRGDTDDVFAPVEAFEVSVPV